MVPCLAQLAFTGEEIDSYGGIGGIEIVVGAQDGGSTSYTHHNLTHRGIPDSLCIFPEVQGGMARWDLGTRTLTVDLPLVYKRSDGQSFDLA